MMLLAVERSFVVVSRKSALHQTDPPSFEFGHVVIAVPRASDPVVWRRSLSLSLVSLPATRTQLAIPEQPEAWICLELSYTDPLVQFDCTTHHG